MKRLNREEQRLLSTFERGKLKSMITSEAALRRYQEYARATLGKPQRMAGFLVEKRAARSARPHRKPRKNVAA